MEAKKIEEESRQIKKQKKNLKRGDVELNKRNVFGAILIVFGSYLIARAFGLLIARLSWLSLIKAIIGVSLLISGILLWRKELKKE